MTMDAFNSAVPVEPGSADGSLRPMRYLDVCAGISASTVAWKPLGWEAAAYSEIEPAPRAVLAHHYPDTPLHGDFTTIKGDEYGSIDLLVGGTPCQDFSVAGLRAGLDGDRGNLSLEFLRLADRTRPRWVVWENVPGVLSQDDGRAFGAILGGMGELGYGVAYRVLDAQFFRLAQRRRRVFVVGYTGDWRGAAAVLSERTSLSGHPAPSRAGQSAIAGTLAAGAHPGGFNGQDAYAGNLIACRVSGNAGAWDTGDRTDALTAAHDGGAQHLVAFAQNQRNEVRLMSIAGACAAEAGMKQTTYVRTPRVRKMTPREWERLQGFPDDYTLVPNRGKPMADGPRYKALGNSMAVPVMRWIGERIAAVEALHLNARIAA
jgi:DNA (cytosine-5)-methyltransferase 1